MKWKNFTFRIARVKHDARGNAQIICPTGCSKIQLRACEADFISFGFTSKMLAASLLQRESIPNFRSGLERPGFIVLCDLTGKELSPTTGFGEVDDGTLLIIVLNEDQQPTDDLLRLVNSSSIVSPNFH